VSRGQRGGSPTVVNLSFLDRTTTYIYIYSVVYISEDMLAVAHRVCTVYLAFNRLGIPTREDNSTDDQSTGLQTPRRSD
jgi:hypothetical protein